MTLKAVSRVQQNNNATNESEIEDTKEDDDLIEEEIMEESFDNNNQYQRGGVGASAKRNSYDHQLYSVSNDSPGSRKRDTRVNSSDGNFYRIIFFLITTIFNFLLLCLVVDGRDRYYPGIYPGEANGLRVINNNKANHMTEKIQSLEKYVFYGYIAAIFIFTLEYLIKINLDKI